MLSRILHDEKHPANNGAEKKTGSEETPTDIWIARIKGTRKARNVAKDCHLNVYKPCTSRDMTEEIPVMGAEERFQVFQYLFERWNAVCDESRSYGVEQGKRRRSLQILTYCNQGVWSNQGK